MTEALEITTFHLTGDFGGTDFIAVNSDVDAYLKTRPGFRWRRITQDEDGTVVDVVAWDSEADARAGAAGIMTELAGSPVHAMIDQATVDFRILPVIHRLD
ncbi:hypothetical protein ABZU76_41335 [Amycolatopsis sp. NPDC005232]|uniref:hypothetical protein n=1 Tax=Amycolatopsis sp. NPDC005232 TaxID=3157027 RepID=UPI0033B6239E